jgi:LPS-assembly protein
MLWGRGPSVAAAQSSGQQRKLFQEDTKKIKQVKAQSRQKLVEVDAPQSEDIDLVAPELTYSSVDKEWKAKGGALLSREGLQVQAGEARVNLLTKEADLLGDVSISSKEGSLSCDSALFNLDDETGRFINARFGLGTGDFSVTAKSATKLTDTYYLLEDMGCTACQCNDDSVPWSFRGSSATITQEGYAHIRNAKFYVGSVPIFYSPYFGFPVKTKRASGLLVPQQVGYSNQDGMRYQQPLFVALDSSSDILFSPFIQTQSRYGAITQYRKSFSLTHFLQSRLWYSNESWRGDSLRGLVTPQGVNPSISENRVGIYHSHSWTSNRDWTVPLSFLSDIHYVSDDNFVREIPDNDIALRSARFTTSSVDLRGSLAESLIGSVRGEYVQSLDNDNKQSDDTIFQRAPEVSLRGLRSLRPFGRNALGAKVVASGGITRTEFLRQQGYEGSRLAFNPQLALPFHFQNYLSHQITLRSFHNQYSLSQQVPNDTVSDSSSLNVWSARYDVSTQLEKVFDVEREGLLSRIFGLGYQSQSASLARVKHVVTPFASLLYTPERNQDTLPLFDSTDRVRQRKLLTYGMSTSLYGRFLPSVFSRSPTPEIVPSVEELTQLGAEETLPPFEGIGASTSSRVPTFMGSKSELATFRISQSYDFVEAQENVDPNRSAFSDVQATVTTTPSTYLSLLLSTNISTNNPGFSSWNSSVRFKDDRADVFSIDYNFVNSIPPPGQPDSSVRDISQLTASSELVLTNRMKVGLYNRYDFSLSQTIEEAIVLRFTSACNCWKVDLGYSNRVNPNREQFTLRFSLGGIGDLVQDVFQRTPQNRGS